MLGGVKTSSKWLGNTRATRAALGPAYKREEKPGKGTLYNSGA